MADVTILAVEGLGAAAFFFLAAAIPRLRNRKFGVTRYSLFGPGPRRTMNYSARTFLILGCIMTAITGFGILSQYDVFGESSGLLIFVFGALLMLVLIVSVALDAVTGDNPKSLKIPTHDDDEVV